MSRSLWAVLACATAFWASSGCSTDSGVDGGANPTTSTGGGTTGATTGGSSTGASKGGASSTGGTGTGTGGSTTGGASTSGGGSTTGGVFSTSSGGSTGGTTGGGVTCPVAAASQCTTPGLAQPGSVVRGVAQLAAGFNPPAGTKGDLVMFLTHVYEGNGAGGGFFHAEDHISNVDLSKGPIPFQIDMCHNDIAMYSEDDCAFNLILILDTNGNNSGTSNFIPDVGEAASRQVINVSCRGPSQCVSATLGCAAGQSCVAFQDPTDACKCASQSCNSDLILCQ